MTTTEHFAIRLSYPSSYLQHSLQSRAGGLFVLVEGVGVDVQRGGGGIDFRSRLVKVSGRMSCPRSSVNLIILRFLIE